MSIKGEALGVSAAEAMRGFIGGGRLPKSRAMEVAGGGGEVVVVVRVMSSLSKG
jgi:hypothetical protein